jgi:8-oxo-dGTP diphosphatase
LLIERGNDPFKGQLALPGGFVEDDETVEQAVVREVQEETGAIWPDGIDLRLVGPYSKPGRDPRGPTLSIAFAALVSDTVHLRAGDDAAAVGWHDQWHKLPLAFDHNVIARDAYAVLQLPEALIKPRVAPYRVDVSELELSAMQRRMLKQLYSGNGAETPANNRTMKALERMGLVEYQERILSGAYSHAAFWMITDLGRAAISE